MAITISTTAVDENNHDFEFAQRGLVATFQDPVIMSDSGHTVVWDTQAYDFLQDSCPDTANPPACTKSSTASTKSAASTSPT